MTINATMINEQADGLGDGSNGQRSKFSATFNGKGASRDLSSLFPTGPLANIGEEQSAQLSMGETKDRFLKELYKNGIKNSEDFHPDFENGYDASDYSYGGSIDLLENVNSKSDSPNKKGPNLRILDIDETGTPILNSDHERSEPQGGQLGNSRGFGTNFEAVNEENAINPSTISYIERKDSNDQQLKPRLGEYININNYLTDP